MRTTVVNVLLDAMLPAHLRDPQRVLDKDGVEALMLSLAKEQPDLYPKVAQFLSEAGAKIAFRRGETFRLDDFRPPRARERVMQDLRKALGELEASKPDAAALRDGRARIFAEFSDRMVREVSSEALHNRNNIAMTVLSGARGKKPQLRDLIATPGYYLDNDGAPIPWFVERSFAEGLSPADFLAGTFAGREAVTGAKKAVAKGGFLAKTFARANAQNFIMAGDCGTTNGIDLEATEKDIRGRVLQREAAGYPAGTVVTRGVWLRLREAGKPVIVRSPMTCELPRGMCAKCFGVTAEGRFPKIGDHVGVTASNAEGEPLAQGALNMKHVVSAAGGQQEFSGLSYIEQFTESPEEFRHRTVVSPVEGVVGGIREAPQGGNYIEINGQEVYVPLGRKMQVKPGDQVEAGDFLTDGLADPEDVLLYKGLGAARRYYADKLGEISAASGAAMDRRNFEVLARTAVDHVELDDPEEEGYLPSDLVSYNDYVHRRKLPENIAKLPLRDAKGLYLQHGALHFSVGTKLTPSTIKKLTEAGFDSVYAAPDPPAFSPRMLRLQQAASFTDDWLGRLGGSYLTRNFADSKMRALDTNILQNTHPVPRLAVGVGYGDNINQGHL